MRFAEVKHKNVASFSNIKPIIIKTKQPNRQNWNHREWDRRNMKDENIRENHKWSYLKASFSSNLLFRKARISLCNLLKIPLLSSLKTVYALPFPLACPFKLQKLPTKISPLILCKKHLLAGYAHLPLSYTPPHNRKCCPLNAPLQVSTIHWAHSNH